MRRKRLVSVLSSLLATTLVLGCGSRSDSSNPPAGKTDGFGGSGTLVINEIAPDPSIDVNGDGRIDTRDEYIEVVNPTPNDVDLTDVTLEDGFSVRFQFPDGAVLKAGAAAVVIARAMNFEAPDGVDVYEAGRLGLNNTGDTVRMRRDGTLMENHGYSTGGSSDTFSRLPDGDPEGVFMAGDATPGTRANGTAFGTNLLSTTAGNAILSSLDNECPDTFCAGDFTYFFDPSESKVECIGDGTCTITGTVTPFFGQQWKADALAGLADSEKTFIGNNGEHRGRLTGETTRDTFAHDGDLLLTFACDLSGGYYGAGEVVEGDDPTDELRNQFLNCVNGMDSLLLSGVPTNESILTPTEAQNILDELDDDCPDSFCGGDFNYFLAVGKGEMSCSTDLCVMEFTVFPFEGQWAEDALSSRTAAQLTASRPGAVMRAMSLSDDIDPVSLEAALSMRIQCELEGEFEPETVYDVDTNKHTHEFDLRFGDCIDAANEVLSSLSVVED